LDLYEMSKETVAKGEGGAELFNAALMLLRFATDKKAKPEDARGWANKAFTAAGAYGPRWQQEIALRMADVLLTQDTFADLALEYARKAERLAEANASWQHQLHIVGTLAEALTKAKKPDEAKEILAKHDQLYLKNMQKFQPQKFAGRKKPS